MTSSFSAPSPQVLMVGVDAADPDYIDQRIKAGGLKNFQRVREQGAWARMKSTFPTLSSAAWSSISTGLPPEKHGIYEFFRRKSGTWQDQVIHGAMKKGEDFWHVASRNGMRTVVINMPITYPPKPVESGVVVSGMDTPGEKVEFVTPKEEKQPFLNEIPDYMIEITAGQYKRIDQFLDAVSKVMDRRMKAARYLFNRHRPDMAVVVFTALDRVLHALWKYVDRAHPASDRPEAAEWRKRVDDLYEQVDGYLGELLDWAGKDSTTIICSDHGGAAVHGVFYLNRWLMREGYLATKGGGSSLKMIGNLQKYAKVVVPRPVKNIVNRIFPNLYANVEETHGLARIDPANTKLYAWRQTAVMRANLAGREPGGTVNPGQEYDDLLAEVAAKLEQVVDDRTGYKPMKKVLTRKDVYPLSDILDDSPDLIIDWGEKIYEVETSLDDPDGPLFVTEELPESQWRREINGYHALYGIFGAVGKGIPAGKDLGDVDILTVAPTMLAAAGIEKLESMTGNVPESFFRDLDEKELKHSSAEDSGGEEGEDDIYSEEERELIEKRLRDLGYM